MDFFLKKLNSTIALSDARSALYRRVSLYKFFQGDSCFLRIFIWIEPSIHFLAFLQKASKTLRPIGLFSLLLKQLFKKLTESSLFLSRILKTCSFLWWVLPLVLYAALMYCSMLWFLFPFFLASCFYAACLMESGSRFLRVGAWSFLASLILIFPCVVVLLEFKTLVATGGALFLLVYTTILIMMSVTCLVIAGRMCGNNHVLKLLSWTSLFVAWWWFVDTFFFVCVGVPCGYVIANPVLCCAVSPYTCAVVSSIGVYGLLALYLLAAGGSVSWYMYRLRVSGLLALVVVGILGVSALTVKVTQKSKTIRYVASKEIVTKDVSVLSTPTNGVLLKDKVSIDRSKKILPTSPWEHIVVFKLTGREKGILERALELQRQFLACTEQVLVPDLIVGPESCLPCALNNEQSLCALFDNPILYSSPQVLLGARRQEVKSFTAAHEAATHKDVTHEAAMYEDVTHETAARQTKQVALRNHNTQCQNEKCFNTAFMLHQGRITYHYDKIFPVPFLETNSPLWSEIFFLQGFFSQKQKVSRAKNSCIENSWIEKSRSENNQQKRDFYSAATRKEGDSSGQYLSEIIKKKPLSLIKKDNGLFLSEGKTPYSVGIGTGVVSLSLGGVTYQARLALCSDFFCTNIFSSEKSFSESNPLLIVLTHDNWFYGTSVADRMHGYAVLWAVCHQIPVLYVGNCYASWIEPSGRTWSLAIVDS